MSRHELVQLFRISRSKTDFVDAHATGTLMQIGEVRFVATTTHTFRHPDITGLIIGLPTGCITLTRDAIVVEYGDHDRESDMIDFGIVILEEPQWIALTEWHTFLDVLSLHPLTHDDRCAQCHFAGYPASRNKVPLNGTELPCQLYRNDAWTDKMLLKHSTRQRHKTHPDDYIALRYDPRNVFPNPQHQFERLKDIKGMSGGAIYAGVSPADNPITGYKYTSHNYIGMLLEHDQKKTAHGEMLIYGLSLLAIQTILKHWYSKGMIQLEGSPYSLPAVGSEYRDL